MSVRDHGFDALTDDELIGLHHVFHKLVRTAPLEGMRAAAACCNEVDERLANRGRLNMATGQIHEKEG